MADIDDDIGPIDEEYEEDQEEQGEEDPEDANAGIIDTDDEASQIVEENSESEDEKIKEIYESTEEKDEYTDDNSTTSDEGGSSDDEELEEKFNIDDKKKYIKTYHTQELKDSYNDINVLSIVERDIDNNIIDDNHKTVPILTKYEKTRILGTRLSQLNDGAKPYINIENTVIIDNNIIAEKELLEKKIPIIIMRPLPNGKKEYWRLSDLEIITY
tara:strand:+ start:1222 stop:1866 length:645 start_codon:yes stop_codon:yes gene_type:complete